MMVETSDGRRISKNFDQGVANTPVSGNVSTSRLVNGAEDVSMEKVMNGLVSDEIQYNITTVVSDNDRKSNFLENGTTLTSPTRDVAATMAMMGAEKTTSIPPQLTATGLEVFPYQKWSSSYQIPHLNVSQSNTLDSDALASDTTTYLPPGVRGTVSTEGGSSGSSSQVAWNAMSALVDAATVAQRENEPVSTGVVGDHGTNRISNVQMPVPKKKTTKRKSRKIIPENKEYVDFTLNDILFGRGGRSNHHPGNKIYREIVTGYQYYYRSCDKNEKTRVAQGIVDQVNNEIGGRFLELDREAKRWYIVPNLVARRKVGQALRENNTEEARAAKRAKYQGRLTQKKKNAALEAASAVGSTEGSSNVSFSTVGGNTNDSSISNIIPLVTAEGSTLPAPMDSSDNTNRVAV